MVGEGMSDVEKAEYDGEDKGVDLDGCRGGSEETECDESGLEVFVPEEAVIGALPEWDCRCGRGHVAIEGVGEIVGVGKVEWIRVEMLGNQIQKYSFIGVLQICKYMLKRKETFTAFSFFNRRGMISVLVKRKISCEVKCPTLSLPVTTMIYVSAIISTLLSLKTHPSEVVLSQ
jgi:hypothetical protein